MKIQHGVNNLWESIRIHVNIKNGSGSKKNEKYVSKTKEQQQQ